MKQDQAIKTGVLLILAGALLVLTGSVFAAAPKGQLLAATPVRESLSREQIQAELRSDPATRDLLVNVDTYKGLVVLHGWVLNDARRKLVVARVRALPGVQRVYSYIAADPGNEFQSDLMLGFRANVADSNMNNRPSALVPTIGLIPAPNDLARRVKVRITADAVAGEFDIKVDSYEGLVLLHGTVPDEAAKSSAWAAASRTTGVDFVLSYIDVGDSDRPAFLGYTCTVADGVYLLPEPTTIPLVELRRPELEAIERGTRPIYVKDKEYVPGAR